MKLNLSSLGLIFEFLGIMAALPFLGYLIDTRLVSEEGSPGAFFIAGVVLGFVSALYHLIKRMKFIIKEMDREDDTGEVASEERDLTERIDDVRQGLQKVEKELDELSRRPRKRSD